MRPTRRQLIAGLASAPLLPACKDDPLIDSGLSPAPLRDPEPARWEPEAPEDPETFAWALLVGEVTPEGARVCLRTLAEAVDLVLMRAEGDGWVEAWRAEGLPVVEGSLVTELGGLSPDTAYNLAAFAGGGRSAVTRFRSALAADGFRQISLGATSCLGGSNPSWGSLARAAEAELDLFLLLGDTVYADGSTTVQDYRAYWSRATSNASMRALGASTSLVATWDDHEVDNNWVMNETVTPGQVEAALSAFREAIPQGQGPEGALWRSLRWGEVLEVFVMDCRGERDPAAGQIVSPAQLDWVREALLASAARFKLVMVSVHFADHANLFGGLQDEDRWQGFPEQRAALRDTLAAVPGAFLVTGDLHYGAMHFVDPPGGAGEGVLEVAAGPGGSFLNPVGEIWQDDANPQYLHILSAWTYARLDLDPATGALQVRLIDDAGEVLAEERFLL